MLFGLTIIINGLARLLVLQHDEEGHEVPMTMSEHCAPESGQRRDAQPHGVCTLVGGG